MENDKNCDICGDLFIQLDCGGIYEVEGIQTKVCDDCYNDVFSGEYLK